MPTSIAIVSVLVLRKNKKADAVVHRAGHELLALFLLIYCARARNPTRPARFRPRRFRVS
jgi:hypothetical protein